MLKQRTKCSRIRSVLAYSLLIAAAISISACKANLSKSGFIVSHTDQHTSGNSKFPSAIDPKRVGTYPPDTKSGAGYFYDDVLEYRVWLHPEDGAEPLNGSKDYFAAFAQYEPAEEFSKKTPGSESPLVLVRQLEWIDEPATGRFVPEKGNRITEWQVAWLADSKRSDKSVADFMKHPHEAHP